MVNEDTKPLEEWSSTWVGPSTMGASMSAPCEWGYRCAEAADWKKTAEVSCFIVPYVEANDVTKERAKTGNKGGEPTLLELGSGGEG
jgi:hypothetical protein